MGKMNKFLKMGLSLALFASMTGISAYAEESEETAEKEETVYVIAGNDGSIEKVIVSDWLKNVYNSSVLNDFTSLENIENVKGYETYEKNDDGSISWKADGADIYYQGTTEKELPVKVNVSYRLNGNDISAEDIAGKSGHIVIRFDYKNDAEVTVTVDGKERTVEVPFGYVTGAVLNGEVFSNVKVTNGKLISDGEKMIAVGVVLPGLRDSLELDSLKKDGDFGIEIPEYIEIEADVNEFEMSDTLTVATTSLFDEIAGGNSADLSDITGKIDELTNAAAQLVDGTEQLHNGTVDLKDGTAKLVDGAGSLRNGVIRLKDGTGELHSKSYDLDNGVAKLNTGVADLKTGVVQVDDGTGTVKEGVTQLSAGSSALAEGTAALRSGIGALFAGAGDLVDGVGTLKTGADAVSAGANDLNVGVNTLKAGFDTPQNEGEASLLQGSAAVANGLGQLNSALQNAGADTSAANGLASAITSAATQAYTDMATAQGTMQAVGTYDQDGARAVIESAIVVSSNTETEYGEPIVTSAGTYGINVHEETYYVPSESYDEEGNPLTVYNPVTVLVCDGTEYIESKEITNTVTITNTVDVSNVMSAVDAYASAAAANARYAQLGEDAQKFGELYNLIAGDSGSIKTAASVVSQATSGMLSTLSANVSALAAGASAVDGGINTIYQGTSALQTGASQLASGAAQVAVGTQSALDGANALKKGTSDISAGTEQVDEGATALRDGAGQLVTGVTSLKKGTEALVAGATTLKNGTDTLKSGTSALVAGTDTLDNGALELLNGAGTLLDGTVTLDDGAQKLLNGTQDLMDGMVRFDREGIQKIAELFGNDASRVLDNFEAVVEAGKTYNTFAGTETNQGSVKFIIRTQSIEK